MKNKETMDIKQLSLNLEAIEKKDITSSSSLKSLNKVINFPSRDESHSDFRERIIADLLRNKVIIDQ